MLIPRLYISSPRDDDTITSLDRRAANYREGAEYVGSPLSSALLRIEAAVCDARSQRIRQDAMLDRRAA